MKKYKNILFDLDGTITDSFEGVANSFIYGLKAFGVENVKKEELGFIMGPPLRDAYMNYFGFDEETAIAAVEKYRERYRTKFLEENRVYDGIEKLLLDLCNRGYKLFLATSKPEVFATQILSHFGLDRYFTGIGAASLDKSRDNKESVLEYIFSEFKIEKEDSVLVGDRFYDLKGAEFVGIDAVGVLYGYGDMEELSQYKNVYIAKTVDDLDKFFG